MHFHLCIHVPLCLEPAEMALMVDGKTDPCSLEENIVFTFSGFPVYGQVCMYDQPQLPCFCLHHKLMLFPFLIFFMLLR